MNSNESPWVFLFSRFSSEALLFEALAIFTLLAIYAAFFVLRKRRFGSIKTQIPAGVVKAYLNELIGDAESLRAQLFGLLYSAGVPAAELTHLRPAVNTGQSVSPNSGLSSSANLQSPQTGGGDPAAVQALEAKLAAQAKQIETFLADKMRVEKELEETRNKGDSNSNQNKNELNNLQEKIGLLEGKLAEYSVIEDDLANLKRLQQENAHLKAQLGGKPAGAGASPSPSTPAGAPASAPAARDMTASPTTPPADNPLNDVLDALKSDVPPGQAPLPKNAASDLGAQARAPEKAATNDPKAPSGDKPLDDAAAFEGLVDQVEQSLEKSAAEASAAVPPSTSEISGATIEKSDADLVAEFEKMLKG